MHIHVGTSGWSYREWRGTFYPPDLPAAQMLRFYASRFSTVEVNNSFYRTPSERVLAGWAEQVPANFRFVMKASRRITHNSRLADENGSLEYFLRAVTPLGPRLGPTLFQLPPTFEKDRIRLQQFLKRLPRRWSAAMEFRHLSWFENPVYDLLRAYNVALVAVDVDEGELESPLVPTASWGYLRLRRAEYDRSSLQDWSRRIQQQPWSEAYVFLKHEEGSPRGPGAAELFRSIVDAP
ncbi:MAG TPA: DUF72 domain-containing protein [Gemmatimonadales bacterium]|nr:DUF72 domain-containing protein [Gemmatimonadales bacterium]